MVEPCLLQQCVMPPKRLTRRDTGTTDQIQAPWRLPSGGLLPFFLAVAPYSSLSIWLCLTIMALPFCNYARYLSDSRVTTPPVVRGRGQERVEAFDIQDLVFRYTALRS